MRVYAVVDDALSDFPLGVELELFVRREDAERFIEEVRGDDPEIVGKLRIEGRELEAGGAEQPTCEGSAGNGHSYAQSLDRVIVTRKGDFSLPRPMMRLWGLGTGLSGAAPCLVGRGRVRPVWAVRSTRSRCQRGFASWPKAGEEYPSQVRTLSV